MAAKMKCPLEDISNKYNCTVPYPDCVNPGGFQLPDFMTITRHIAESCLNDSRLAHIDGQIPTLGNAALTYAAGKKIEDLRSWAKYPGGDIWARLTTWKFPLLTLIAFFPRPPISINVETFVLIHLIGSPINTIESMLFTLSNCQSRATYWRHQFGSEGNLSSLVPDESDHSWKALTLITISYDEWGLGDDFKDLMLQELYVPCRVIHTIER